MNKCQECQAETKNPKFCSSSCAAKFHNKNRIDKCPNKNGTKICKCIKCETEVEVNIRHNPNVVKCEICKGKCVHCKQPANFKLKNGNLCCSDSANKCPFIKEKNAEGVKLAHSLGKIPGWKELREKYQIDTAWSRGLTAYDDFRIRSKYDPENLFTNGFYVHKGPYKEILIKERGHKCEKCENIEWLGHPITLELDHIDGNNINNTKENLRLLCPNCHSQTDTWRGRNSNKGRRKVPEETLIEIFKETKNIHRTLILVGLTPKGANYQTMYKLIDKYELNYLLDK